MSMSGGLSKPAARAAVSNFSYRRHEVDVATGGLDVWAISSQVRVGSASLRRAVSLTASGRSDVAMNHSSSAGATASAFDGSGSTEDPVCSEGSDAKRFPACHAFLRRLKNAGLLQQLFRCA